MQDAYKAGKIDYFYLPTIENGKTDASEFCVNSGIGMAFNAKHLMQKPKTLYFTYWITMVKICSKTADVTNQNRTSVRCRILRSVS